MEQIAEAAEQATAAAIVAGRAAGAFTLVAAVEPSFEPCETAFALAAGIARVVAGVMGTAATHVVAAAVTALAAPVEEATPAAFVTARATAAATRPDWGRGRRRVLRRRRGCRVGAREPGRR